MKREQKLFISVIVAYALIMTVLIIVMGCTGNKVQPSMEDQQFQKMSGTWKTSTVEVDGADITDQYIDFKLTIFKNGNVKEMVATNPGHAFYGGADVWVFAASSQASRIIRSSDGIEMNIQVDQSHFTLTFIVPQTSTTGRFSGLSGNFTFHLVRD